MSLKLGGSLRRNRKQAEGVFTLNHLRRLLGSRRAGWMAGGSGLALLGLTLGYLVATHLLFPPPPPPGTLRTVPNLRGGTPEAASLEILDAGLTPGTVERIRHPEADSGAVIAQAPLPGQLLRPGAAVRVTVSLGPERRPIPDVVGLRNDWALSLLEAAGFAVTQDSSEAAEPRGTVLALDPEPGTELALPGEVLITISLGPPLVTMPRLLGMDEIAARDTLEALGLNLIGVDEVFRFGRDRGIVVEQVPPADSLLELGSAVRLSVGRGRRR